jgi:uncharacterized membrane protein
MRIAFWVVVASVLAVISHITTLLYAPALTFERTLSQLVSDNPRNKFFVLSSDAQHKIFPDFPKDAIFGLCRFDLRNGPVTLHANLPHTFWTFTVYSRTGKTLYTVNDRQAGVDSFNLQLVKAPSILDVFSAKDDEDVVEASVWRVQATDPKGFALFWVPTEDPAMRPSLVDTLAQSTCTVQP